MNNLSRVFISGMGVVSPNGVGLTEYWYNTKEGVSGVKKINFFDTSQHKVKIAGYIQNLKKVKFSHQVSDLRYDRVSLLLKIAVDEALITSGLQLEEVADPQIGVIFGIGMSGMQSLERWYKDYELCPRRPG